MKYIEELLNLNLGVAGPEPGEGREDTDFQQWKTSKKVNLHLKDERIQVSE